MFALVDCNNFYASCQRVFEPHLLGKPVVILSNNDGCVIARSNEAKALGIPMGVYAALRRGTWLSQLFMTVSLLGVSLPTFLIGILLILVFAVGLGWLPSFGRGEVVSYDELFAVVKSGRNRDNIRKHVSTIRDAFREIDPAFEGIENVPMRGFRWVAR